MVSPGAFLFDLGETLYTYKAMPPSWVKHYRAAMSGALASAGVDPSKCDLEKAAFRLGQFNTRIHPRQKEASASVILGPVLDSYGLAKAMQSRIIGAFFDFYRASLTVYPEAPAVLGALKAGGVKTGALTDVAYGMPRPLVEEDLRRVNLLSFLDRWLTSVDVGWRKPNPAGYLKLCEVLETAPADSVYVGNEEKDMRGAKVAGLKAVLIHRDGGAVPDWGQDAVFSDLGGCLEFA